MSAARMAELEATAAEMLAALSGAGRGLDAYSPPANPSNLEQLAPASPPAPYRTAPLTAADRELARQAANTCARPTGTSSSNAPWFNHVGVDGNILGGTWTYG